MSAPAVALFFRTHCIYTHNVLFFIVVPFPPPGTTRGSFATRVAFIGWWFKGCFIPFIHTNASWKEGKKKGTPSSFLLSWRQMSLKIVHKTQPAFQIWIQSVCCFLRLLALLEWCKVVETCSVSRDKEEQQGGKNFLSSSNSGTVLLETGLLDPKPAFC